MTIVTFWRESVLQGFGLPNRTVIAMRCIGRSVRVMRSAVEFIAVMRYQSFSSSIGTSHSKTQFVPSNGLPCKA
jgi:hypothetical protein